RVQVVASDKSGNSQVAGTSVFSVDSTPPSAPGVGLASRNPTNSTSAQFTVNSCSDADKIFISECATTPMRNATRWQNCSTTSGTFLHTLSSSDGTNNLYAFSQDSAGHVSSATSLSLVLDSTAPTL